jgi:hypothetical protein
MPPYSLLGEQIRMKIMYLSTEWLIGRQPNQTEELKKSLSLNCVMKANNIFQLRWENNFLS